MEEMNMNNGGIIEENGTNVPATESNAEGSAPDNGSVLGKVIIGGAAVIGAAYFAWRHHKKKKAKNDSGEGTGDSADQVEEYEDDFDDDVIDEQPSVGKEKTE